MSSGAIANNAVVQEAIARAQLAAANAPSSDRLSTGQKRPRGDDDQYVPAKRANDAQPAMNQGPSIVETIEIPDNVVGLVIGRRGEQISSIQQQTGCRVQMASEPTPNNTRLCTLNGSRPQIDNARNMISDVITRSNMRQNEMAANTNTGVAPGLIQETIMVPGVKCGLIIGRNGETIKGLQETLGVKMLLIQESQAISQGSKPLRITGTPDKVQNARRTIEGIINSEDGNRGPSLMKAVGEVIVPRASVGIIIGKGGDTIKRLGNESGCKIQFKPDDNPNSNDRCATLQGTPEQIARATQLISELLQRSQNSGAQETFLMHVPANKTGLVIGKGGDTIKQICLESGAHVELSRDPPPNGSEKIFVIKGSPYQIHHAQHIIRIKVGDIPPGTPVPHFSGGAAGAVDMAAGMYQNAAAYGYDGYGQWNQNGAMGQDPNWANYYQQQGQGQQGYQYSQAGSAPQQQPQAQAQASAGGGAQQDYSAAWADYYRQMGMHDKAALVEQQVKAQQGGAGAVPTSGSGGPQQFGGAM